jgi:hypothetical protein
LNGVAITSFLDRLPKFQFNWIVRSIE